MNIKIKAFSLIEIIITVSIITILAVIWLSSKQWYEDNSKNAKVMSSVQTINNALQAYIQENNSLPTPDWNLNYYKSDTSYAHSYEDSKTFWVYWLITENTIPKRYLDETPLDPRTNSYYSYGKTKNKNQFEVASIQIVDGNPVSKVIWNYSAENWPYNLIREYNWPNFVYNNSKSNFAYNPYEFKFVAKIANIKWTVEIKTKQWLIITDNNVITKYNLWVWDRITVSIWSTAQIHFSDWSTSVIWDNNQETNVTISEMIFKWKNNLSTFVKLYLWAGSIWTKATHLNENSNFEIYTNDLTAAVRWTIFWVTKDSISTKVTVIEWEIDIYINGVFIETITANNWEIIKAEINETINTKTNISITEAPIPEFINATDIRTTQTVNNINNQINVDNQTTSLNQSSTITLNPDTILPVTNNDTTTSPITQPIITSTTLIPVPTQISWFWCSTCPDWYNQSGSNRAWLKCWTFWWKRDERYCNWVKWTDWSEVICSTERPKWWWSSSCNWWDDKNWNWVY